MGGRTEQAVRAWLRDFVVGMNLCPFARPLLGADTLRISVTDEVARPALLQAFLLELDLLQSSTEERIATTLLVFPNALGEFEDYLDLLDEAQNLLEQAGLAGVVQLASFHPQYCFEGEAEDAPGNYSNRAPYPIFHLLREGMLTRVLANYDQPEQIPQHNIETLEQLGQEELARRWQALHAP